MLSDFLSDIHGDSKSVINSIPIEILAKQNWQFP